MIKEKFQHCPRFLLRTVKTTDSHFVPIPTLRRNDSGIEPCQVGISTSPDKVRIATLRRTLYTSMPPSLFRIFTENQSLAANRLHPLAVFLYSAKIKSTHRTCLSRYLELS